MKKYLLICLFLCGIFSAVSAQQKKSATVKQKHGKTVKSNKKSATILRSKSAKKAAWKKSATKSKRHGKKISFTRLTNRKRAIKPAVLPTEPPIKLNPEEMVFGTGLASNRGKLPWPVDGTVSIPYGEYSIEGTRIKGMNPGITISTSDKDVPVKAVYDGIVSEIDNRGEVSSIFIRHGKYYTVYSNVSSILVNKGEVVKGGDIIGNVGEAYETSGGELNFLVMDNRNNVDPSRWLSHQ